MLWNVWIHLNDADYPSGVDRQVLQRTWREPVHDAQVSRVGPVQGRCMR